MVKVVVCLPDAEAREKIAASLEGAGLSVFRRCATGAEALRAVETAGESVIVCAPKLRDRTADELAYDLDGGALALAIGKPQALNNCEHTELFKLPMPFSARELASSVKMLMQLCLMRKPRRTDAEQSALRAAKARIMKERLVTENEAHHILQRLSMESGRRLIDVAQSILKEHEQNA